MKMSKNSFRTISLALLAPLSLLLFGCGGIHLPGGGEGGGPGGSGGSPPSSTPCEPGEIVACGCGDLPDGTPLPDATQVCAADGQSLGPCSCVLVACFGPGHACDVDAGDNVRPRCCPGYFCVSGQCELSK